MAARRWRVSGRVQGVWFRGFTRAEAQRLAVRGSARNEPDGSVLVEGFGTPDALDALESLLHRGPEHARVSGVERLGVPEGDGPPDFTTG